MPLERVWEDEPLIIGFRLSGQVTVDDLKQMGKQGLSIAESAPIYVLITFTEVESMPRNLINTALRSNSLVSFINHDNTRGFVFVAPSQATRLMIETVFRSTPYHIVDERERGLALLRDEMIPGDSGE